MTMQAPMKPAQPAKPAAMPGQAGESSQVSFLKKLGLRNPNAMKHIPGSFLGKIVSLIKDNGTVAPIFIALLNRFASPNDLFDIQRAIRDIQSGRPLSIRKEVNGVYRWVLIASGAYQDRDRQWVREKALQVWTDSLREVDGELVRPNGETIPLRWWHVGGGDPVTLSKEIGLDIGSVDFAAMHGKSLILSGTFISETMAKAFASEKNADLGCSIRFFHSISEPDSENAFNAVDVFEVSLLPEVKASYPFTSYKALFVEEVSMDKDKVDELKKRVGESVAEAVLDQAEKKEAEAVASGVEAKAISEVPVVPETPVQESIPAQPDQLAMAMKEFTGVLSAIAEKVVGLEKRLATLEPVSTSQKGLAEQVERLHGIVAALNSDLPRRTSRELRQSEADTTVVSQERAKELGAPAPNPKNDFISGFVLKL